MTTKGKQSNNPRFEAFRADLEQIENKHGYRITATLIYTKEGIFPQVLVKDMRKKEAQHGK